MANAQKILLTEEDKKVINTVIAMNIPLSICNGCILSVKAIKLNVFKSKGLKTFNDSILSQALSFRSSSLHPFQSAHSMR